MRNTLMRSLALAALLAATAACQTAAMPAPTASSAHIVAAIADPARGQLLHDERIARAGFGVAA